GFDLIVNGLDQETTTPHGLGQAHDLAPKGTRRPAEVSGDSVHNDGVEGALSVETAAVQTGRGGGGDGGGGVIVHTRLSSCATASAMPSLAPTSVLAARSVLVLVPVLGLVGGDLRAHLVHVEGLGLGDELFECASGQGAGLGE